MFLTLRPAVINSAAPGAFGLITLDKDALAAPTLPDPLDDDAPWMHWEHFNAELETNSPAMSRLIDVKIKRKLLGERQGLAFVIQLLGGAATVEVSLGVRVLLGH